MLFPILFCGRVKLEHTQKKFQNAIGLPTNTATPRNPLVVFFVVESLSIRSGAFPNKARSLSEDAKKFKSIEHSFDSDVDSMYGDVHVNELIISRRPLVTNSRDSVHILSL